MLADEIHATRRSHVELWLAVELLLEQIVQLLEARLGLGDGVVHILQTRSDGLKPWVPVINGNRFLHRGGFEEMGAVGLGLIDMDH